MQHKKYVTWKPNKKKKQTYFKFSHITVVYYFGHRVHLKLEIKVLVAKK